MAVCGTCEYYCVRGGHDWCANHNYSTSRHNSACSRYR